MNIRKTRRTLWLWPLCWLSPLMPSAQAQGFATYVSPPRLELRLQAGARQREVIEIQHAGQVAGRYRFYTVDWTLGSDGGASFSSALAPNSCRPWVAIERRELTLAPGARYRYRIEVAPPEGLPPQECRFALMVEGMDQAQVSGDLSFPVGGRIAVIVYAAVGDAAPQLEWVAARWETRSADQGPVLEVRNTGTAHGRLDGVLQGKDADGRRSRWVPVDTPILPGETRHIALRLLRDDDAASTPPPPIQRPLALTGELEWADKKMPVRMTLPP